MNLTKLETKLLSFFQKHPTEYFNTQELKRIFNFRGTRNYKKMIKAIAYLERTGHVTISERGEISLRINKTHQEIQGVFRSHEKGFGFVNINEEEPDLFIPPGKTMNALDGDLVKIKILKQVNPQTGKGSEAQVLEIIEHNNKQIIGEFKRFNKSEKISDYIGYVIPQDKKYRHLTIYIEEGGITTVDQMMVVVKITKYPTHRDDKIMTGILVKEIGHRNAPGVDILSILYKLGIPHEFPQSVKDELNSIPDSVLEDEYINRVDLREEIIFTIDGEDAKDIDDAISLKKHEDNTYLLGVHIADVSHYVKPGSAIDAEAKERGTSVYLADRVVPMLPEKLSNGICSLHPDEDRLTKTCQMLIDHNGKVIRYQIFDSVINSKYRMTYSMINSIYNENSDLMNAYSELIPILFDMKDLHKILSKKRYERGAIDFDSQESQIILDEDGMPTDILLRQRGVSERMIESFMLVANETIAKHLQKTELPALYRIHDQPDVEKINRFAEFITSFGLILTGETEQISPKKLQSILDKAKNQPFEPVLSMMLLRSMQQAKYYHEPLGHYGLATEDYTHFTAPIRRYPDLMIHRLLTIYSKNNISPKIINHLEEILPGISEHTSKMERRAIEAERETVALKKTEYMLDKIGEVYEGQISSITSFGMFVQLSNTIEGLIRIENIPGDFYHFDERHLLLIGEKTKTIYQIGQKVTIEVSNVNVDEREIDFNLLDAEKIDRSQLLFNPQNYLKKQKSSKRHKRNSKKNKKSFKIKAKRAKNKKKKK